MTYRRMMWLALALLPAPGRAWADGAAYVPVLTNAAAWQQLPPAEEGAGQTLPAWIRALAGPLPNTAAAMIQLDYVQRAGSVLPPQLRAKLRWMVADANRCEYARAYARFDYVRAGGKGEDLDELPRRLGQLPEAERLALQLVRQLAEAAYTVTDDQVARLVKLYGEKQIVAIVLVAAYSNFQDRLLLALGIPLEPDGPLPPVKVRFAKLPAPAKSDEKGKETPKRKLSPPAPNPPPVPTRVEDPEWTAIPYEALQKRLAGQKDRRRARIPIPEWETVRDNYPADLPRPSKPTRIRWTLLNSGYQPRLNAAWGAGLRAFRQESDLSVVQQESMFWVVTRSLQCFY